MRYKMDYNEERLKFEKMKLEGKKQLRVAHKAYNKSMKKYLVAMDFLIITML